MRFFNVLFLLLVSCKAAEIPEIRVGNKIQWNKTFAFQASIIKFHYVLRCGNKEFTYKLKLIEDDIISDDTIGIKEDTVVGGTYDLIDSWDSMDGSDRYEFNVEITHTCLGKESQVKYKEALRCPVMQEQCQFYFEVDLETNIEDRYKCNEGGYCDVMFLS